MDLLGHFPPAPTATVISAILLVVASVLALTNRRRRQLPPGPSKLTSFISTVFKHGDILQYREGWRAQFGKVYTTFLGLQPEVIVTDYDTIHEIFVERADVTSSRPPGGGALVEGVPEKGIIGSPHWKEQRRFALTVLREQGMGKIDMEEKILEEISPFLQEIEKQRGKPLKVDSYVYQAVSNVICNLVLGSRFEYHDPVFVTLIDTFLNQVKHLRKMSVIEALPILQKLPGDVFGYHKYMRDATANRKYFLDAIRQHAENLDPNNPKDFIDAYLIEIKSRAEMGQPSSFDEMNCIAVVIQLFVAGTDTTSNTLHWAWIFMAIYPEIQKRVQDEIEAIIGSRPPSLTDKTVMPYTEAVLTEVMRLANIAVSTLPHKTDEDMRIGNYLVAKDTQVTAALSDVHLDESTYPVPKLFNPERFLNSDGQYEKPKKFIPFGIGRRVCIGESLARAELFLFFTSMLQNFNIEAPPGSTLVAKGKVGLVHNPISQDIVFKKRQ